jgi:teichuronic acid biosynthesis glycosyltransferase TuaG
MQLDASKSNYFIDRACFFPCSQQDSNFAPLSNFALTWQESQPFRLLIANQFSTPTVMLKANLPQRFADGKYYSEDYLLWCEICLDGNSLFRTNTVLALAFKRPYGSAGLSASLSKMASGEFATYSTLFQSGRITMWTYLGVRCFSGIKYLRRILMSKKQRWSATN